MGTCGDVETHPPAIVAQKCFVGTFLGEMFLPSALGLPCISSNIPACHGRSGELQAQGGLVRSFHPSAYCDLLAGFSWVLVTVLSGVFLLLSVAGLCFAQLYIFPSPSEMHLPKALVSEQPSSSLLPTRAVAEPWSPPFTRDSAPTSLCSCTTKPVSVPR